MTAQDILDMIKERELVLANTIKISQNPREVYKDVKIKRGKEISRTCEETDLVEVSGETYPLAGGLSDYPTSSSASPSLGRDQEEVSQMVVVSNTAPATTSSRTLTGISAQHTISNRGIQVHITMQTAEDAQTGDCITVTAELKRHDRLRELKPYEYDSEEFGAFAADMIEQLKKIKGPEKDKICVGRVHERGGRNPWFKDVLVVGHLNDAGVIKEVVIWYGDEEYHIVLDNPLSPKQQGCYHSTGIYGSLKSTISVPTLNSAKRSKFRG